MVIKLDGTSTFISGVKCILGQYAFRPSVNLECDYKLIFQDNQRRYLK